MVDEITNRSSNSIKKHAIVKIIIMVAVIIAGISIAGVGLDTFVEEEPVNTHDGKTTEIKLPSSIATFHTTLTAPGGFFPDHHIRSHVQLTLEEEVANSTNIQVVFSGGRITSIVDRSQISVYNDPIILNYEGHGVEVGKNMSRYDANLELRYDSPGTYDVEIIVELQSKEPYKEKLPNEVEIKSLEEHIGNKNKREQSSFTLMILGISLISTSPAFAKVFEYLEDIKNN
ncbi:MAG: hypothetical protein ACW9W4_01200 [Candidatus Nitrosopumilus sp. bin_7KS]